MDFISPKQLAQAAGVSESSVKRWCDQGRISMVKTAGGHRRLGMDAAVAFLRFIGSDVKPEYLGLPARNRRKDQGLAQASDDLKRVLIEGEQATVNQILLDLYVDGISIARISDNVIAPAFRWIGEEWECHRIDVYHERRSCGICHQALDEILRLLPAPKNKAPLAVGCTPECDPYTLPTMLVNLTLRQSGWKSESLGSRLPFHSMQRAIRDLKPRVFWLSVSHIDDVVAFIDEYRDFYERVPEDVDIIVGGRGLTESVRKELSYTAHCDNLFHLETLSKTLKRVVAKSEPRSNKG